MPPNIRDEDTNRWAEQVERSIPLRERLRPLQDRMLSQAATGLEAGKAFYDALGGHG